MKIVDIEKILSISLPDIEKTFKGRNKLIEMYKKNFVVFFQKYAEILPDGTLFASPSSGIYDMWLRDASGLVGHLLPFLKDDKDLQKAIAALIKRNTKYMLVDPYANGFKKAPDLIGGWHDKHEEGYEQNPIIHERKYELDTITYPLRLAYIYYKNTGDIAIFDFEFKQMLETVIDLFETEQHHRERSKYRFERENCPETDTLKNNGLGAEIGYTGMIYSAFSAGDDATVYGYLTASNLLAARCLEYMCEIVEAVWKDNVLISRMKKLCNDIRMGVEKYCIVQHPVFGKVYSYDTDGLGNHILRDDALLPNLISLPYYGLVSKTDEIYQNTRNLITSKHNPNYCFGKKMQGLTSIHNPGDNIWPLAVIMQAITANTKGEKDKILDMLASTDNGSFMIHETINADDPTIYTWDEFCFPSALFCELMYLYTL